ncbi:hypothetical protein JXB28_02035 [Candidatus Woesearchaeota archaeon]|nr:hypothetical protein [Candidatus Woesearchaeota archaeon]
MENKLILGLVFVLGLSLLANALLMVELKHQRQEAGEELKATGFSTKSQDVVLLKEDVLEIKREKLEQCCSFMNTHGEEDRCYVLEGYDCAYCREYCS